MNPLHTLLNLYCSYFCICDLMTKPLTYKCMKKAMLFFTALLAAIGCSEDETTSIPLMEDPNTVAETLVLSAVIDNDSLVSNLDSEDASYDWTEGDIVKLYRVENGAYTGDVVELTYAKDTRFYIEEEIEDGDYIAYFTGDWSRVTDPVAGGDLAFEIGAVQSYKDGVSRLADYLLLSGEVTIQFNEVANDVTMSHRTSVLHFSVGSSGDIVKFALSSPNTISYTQLTFDSDAVMSRREPTSAITLEFLDPELEDGETDTYEATDVWVALSVWEVSDVAVLACSLDASSSFAKHTAALSGSHTFVQGESIPLDNRFDVNIEPYTSTNVEIATAEDLALLAEATNLGAHSSFLYYTFTQTDDIDLSDYDNWTPIGLGSATPFKGTYDGGYNSIYNLQLDDQTLGETVNEITSARGLFGYVAGNATNYLTPAYIKNIRIESGSVSANGRAVGAICGYAINAQFYECYNGASVENRGSYDNVTVVSDETTTTTTYPIYAGGIVGKLGANVVFIGGCMNAGKVSATGTGDSTKYVGGIVGGGGTTGTNWNNSFMTLCSLNTGVLDAGSSNSYAGGIIGYLPSSTGTARSYIVASLHWSSSITAATCGYIAGSATDEVVDIVRYCYTGLSSYSVAGSGDADVAYNCKNYLNISDAQEGWGVAPSYWAVNSHFNENSVWDSSYIFWDQSSYSVSSRPKLNLETK